MSLQRHPLGHGIGLRTQHFAQVLEAPPPVGFMEAVSENFMSPGGRPLAVLEKVRRDVPVILHGVSMSIGSVDPIPPSYLHDLKSLVDRIDPVYVSDHLCWGTHAGRYGHDLWPLPYTEEALEHVVSRVHTVQDALRRQILLENVSTYAEFGESTMAEWTFLSEIARRADCGILLDVNNIYVSAVNHGFDAEEYVSNIPIDRVGYFHLAGHSNKGKYLLDTHDHPVPDPVWALYRSAVRRFGKTPSVVEWDDQIPALEVVVAESRKAAAHEAEILQEVAP